MWPPRAGPRARLRAHARMREAAQTHGEDSVPSLPHVAIRAHARARAHAARRSVRSGAESAEKAPKTRSPLCPSIGAYTIVLRRGEEQRRTPASPQSIAGSLACRSIRWSERLRNGAWGRCSRRWSAGFCAVGLHTPVRASTSCLSQLAYARASRSARRATRWPALRRRSQHVAFMSLRVVVQRMGHLGSRFALDHAPSSAGRRAARSFAGSCRGRPRGGELRKRRGRRVSGRGGGAPDLGALTILAHDMAHTATMPAMSGKWGAGVSRRGESGPAQFFESTLSDPFSLSRIVIPWKYQVPKLHNNSISIIVTG